jgi:chemotaxis protein CheX
MADINSLDFKTFLANATNDIFDTMLSMKIEVFDVSSNAISEKDRIVGSVGFAGEVIGCMNIHVGYTFAKAIAGAMLGEEPTNIEEEGVLDVVGELSNMIGGDVKSRLCDAGLMCSLSIPTTTSGSDFTIETQGWFRHERLAIRSDQHVAIIEVYVKFNNSN